MIMCLDLRALTFPELGSTQGRLTRETNWTVGGVSGYSGPQWMFTLYMRFSCTLWCYISDRVKASNIKRDLRGEVLGWCHSSCSSSYPLHQRDRTSRHLKSKRYVSGLNSDMVGDGKTNRTCTQTLLALLKLLQETEVSWNFGTHGENKLENCEISR